MKNSPTRSLFETLETRRLMAALTLTGTPGADVFKVDVVAAGDTLTINGMGGDDVVYFGQADHTVQNILGDIVISNPTGTTFVAADDGKDILARHAVLTTTSLTGLAPGNISFDAGASVSLDGGTNNDTFTVNGTGLDTWIGGGWGDDRYEINQHHGKVLRMYDPSGHNEFSIADSSGNLDNITGSLALDGGGESSVVLNDSQSPVGHTYWLAKYTGPAAPSSAKLARSGSALDIDLQNVGAVSLRTSGFDDVVYLTSATSQTPTFGVLAGDGNDTIFANDDFADSITGGNGNDTATVDVYDVCDEVEIIKTPASSGSVSGVVFADKNGNGVQDAGEFGLQGIQLYLDQNNNKVWDSGEAGTITDASGNWSFIGVPSGKEFIARLFLTTNELAQTTPINATGIHVTLSPGQIVTGRKFGLKEVSAANGSISGTVFNDLDGDRMKDANEAGLSGRTVYIDLDNDKVLDANEKSATTDASGHYKLSGLAAGTYKVRQVLPAGWSQTTPTNGYGINVTLSTNQAASGKIFGEKQIAPAAASISGTVFWDANANGKRDAGESGLAGRTLWIDLDNDKILDAGEKSTVTDANGNWTIAGLGAGTYKVRQQVPSGWAQTKPSNGYGINVTVATNQHVMGKLFGERKTA